MRDFTKRLHVSDVNGGVLVRRIYCFSVINLPHHSVWLLFRLTSRTVAVEL